MYKHILLPLDGSRLAEQVVPYAQQVAKASKAKVTLLNVVSPVDARVSNEAIEKMLQSERSSLEQHLKKVEEAFRGRGIETQSVIVTGNPADEIVRAVADRKCDLVTMATRGHSGIGRWMFGSTADKVLHAVSSPLLLIRPADQAPALSERPIQRILVALDGSELAESVLPAVEDVAKTMQLEIALIRVVPISTFAMASMEPYAYDPRIDEALTKAATDYLAGSRSGSNRKACWRQRRKSAVATLLGTSSTLPERSLGA